MNALLKVHTRQPGLSCSTSHPLRFASSVAAATQQDDQLATQLLQGISHRTECKRFTARRKIRSLFLACTTPEQLSEALQAAIAVRNKHVSAGDAPVYPDHYFSNYMRQCKELDAPAAALQGLQQLRLAGFQPSNATIGRTFDWLATKDDPGLMTRAYVALKANRVAPSRAVTHPMVLLFSRLGQPEVARSLVREFEANNVAVKRSVMSVLESAEAEAEASAAVTQEDKAESPPSS